MAHSVSGLGIAAGVALGVLLLGAPPALRPGPLASPAAKTQVPIRCMTIEQFVALYRTHNGRVELHRLLSAGEVEIVGFVSLIHSDSRPPEPNRIGDSIELRGQKKGEFEIQWVKLSISTSERAHLRALSRGQPLSVRGRFKLLPYGDPSWMCPWVICKGTPTLLTGEITPPPATTAGDPIR